MLALVATRRRFALQNLTITTITSHVTRALITLSRHTRHHAPRVDRLTT